MIAPIKMNDIIPIRYILLTAFVIRLFVPLLAAFHTQDHRVFHLPDTASYVRSATELIYSGQFARNGIPDIVRTPGYPLLLVPGILLGNTELVTITLQIILSCLTVYLVFRIALLLFERVKIATLCALLYAIEPLSILYATKLLTETLFTYVVVLFLYLLLQYMKKGSLAQLLIAAVALSASVYVRPISYFLPILIAVILILWILTKRQNKSKLLFHTCLFFTVTISLTALWQMRNMVEAGYSGFSAVADKNLYFYQAASVLAVRQGIPFYEMQKQMGYQNTGVYFANHPDQRDWSQSKRYRYMRKEGVKILLQYPSTYLTIHLKGMLWTLLGPGATEYLRLFKFYPESGGLLGLMVDKGLLTTLIFVLKNNPLMFWTNLFLSGVLILYFLFGVIALLSRNLINNISIITLLSVGAYFFAISGGPHSYGRFRHPIMPILCILAGYGLSEAISRFRKVSASHKHHTFDNISL